MDNGLQVVQQMQQQIQLLKTTLCKDLGDDEFKLFWNISQRTRLDPLRRQIYAIKRQGRMTIQTGIEGYRAIASRNPNYAGQEGPFWCGKDGVWKDHWVDDVPPVAAKVGVRRKDWDQPTYAIANVKSFAVASNPLWKTMPEHMIAVRAEALALRKAFPEDLSGIYTEEEMDNPDSYQTPHTVQQTKVKTLQAPVEPEVYTGAAHQKALVNEVMDQFGIDAAEKGNASMFLISRGVPMHKASIHAALQNYLKVEVVSEETGEAVSYEPEIEQ